jgi:hypothetical protein
VEPRGFELLTSAVQRRSDSLLGVSRIYKIDGKGRIFAMRLFSRFQDIHLGCCTVAAHERSEELEPATYS